MLKYLLEYIEIPVASEIQDEEKIKNSYIV